MIKVSCKNSKDPDYDFEVCFIKNFIVIGSDINSDIRINNTKTSGPQLSLEVKKELSYLYPSKGVNHFYHNTNKTTSTKRVFIKDSFSIGSYTFEVLELGFTPMSETREIINLQTEQVLLCPVKSQRIKEIHERV